MKIIWKTFVLLVLMTSLVFLGTYQLTKPLHHVNADSGNSDSSIAGIVVEDLKEQEIIDLLNSEIESWKRNSIKLVGNGIDLTLAPEWFLFDVEGTVDTYINQTNKPWYAFWESEPLVQMPLVVSLENDLKFELQKSSHLNVEETMGNIEISAGNLSRETIETVILDISILESERLAFSLVPISSDLVGLNEIIELLNETVLNSGEIISFNDFFNESSITYHDNTADFVASALYSTVLNTNFEIVERHSQGKMPNYLEPGIEANVEIFGDEDFKFLNKNASPVILKLSMKESNLLVEFYSVPSDITAKYEVVEKVVVNPRTIYRYSADLNVGQEELVQEGQPGLRVTVLRTVSEKKGPFEKQEKISRDYYPPIHRVIVKSLETSPELSNTDKLEENDLNGDGLPDMNEDGLESSTGTGSKGEDESELEDLDTLPVGSYYDKAGNIIVPE